MDELRERQVNEISVLKSIFSNNFSDLSEPRKENKPQKKSLPASDVGVTLPVFQITLLPQTSESQLEQQTYVKVDLKVKFTSKYPNE
jgi:hypothetical protein